MVQTLLDEQIAQLAKAKAAFQECTKRLGARAHWTDEPDYPGKSLSSDHAAEADLVICGPEHGPATIVAQASDVIFECGLPALMIPPDIHRLRFDTIVVAWRDKPEARRAVSAALPLLQQADLVVLLSVEPNKDEGADSGLTAVQRRLDRHGVKSTPLLRHATNAEAPMVIMDTARAHGAGLIVLGAYGHSRAREWILGGVTDSLLNQSRTPLLLVH